jgi:hypothetical protein
MEWDWVKQYEGSKLFSIFINILLVYTNARLATLIEWNDFEPDERKHAEEVVKEVLKDLKLESFVDPFADYRIFVIKKNKVKHIDTQEDIGNLLEFYCSGHDFDNQDKYRIGGSIYEITTDEIIYAEVCETNRIEESNFEDSLAHKVKMFDEAMKKLDLPYRFVYYIKNYIPRNELINNYKNKEYVKQNLGEYSSLLFNDFFINTKFSKDPELILKESKVFEKIMEKIKKDEFNHMYNDVEPLSDEYYKLLEKLELMEDKWLRKKSK